MSHKIEEKGRKRQPKAISLESPGLYRHPVEGFLLIIAIVEKRFSKVEKIIIDNIP